MVRKAVKRFYDDEQEAIKSAKTCAKTSYKSQFVYKNAETGQMLIRSEPVAGLQPYLKVKFDGSIERYKESEIQES